MKTGQKTDFYPVMAANKLLFLDNLVRAVGTVGTTVDLLPADLTATTTVRMNLRNAVNDMLAAMWARPRGGCCLPFRMFQ